MKNYALVMVFTSLLVSMSFTQASGEHEHGHGDGHASRAARRAARTRRPRMHGSRPGRQVGRRSDRTRTDAKHARRTPPAASVRAVRRAILSRRCGGGLGHRRPSRPRCAPAGEYEGALSYGQLPCDRGSDVRVVRLVPMLPPNAPRSVKGPGVGRGSPPTGGIHTGHHRPREGHAPLCDVLCDDEPGRVVIIRKGNSDRHTATLRAREAPCRAYPAPSTTRPGSSRMAPRRVL